MIEQTTFMPQNEWNDLCASTSHAMAGYVLKFMTPISRVVSDEEGELEGTGSYVAIDNAAFLLTNEHVAAAMSERHLGHMYHGSDLVYALRSDFASISAPTDAAIARVDMPNTVAAAPVSLSLYADRHEPMAGELLFIAGYPGQRSKFVFGTLVSPLTPYLTQEDVAQSAVLGVHHFALPWRPDRAWSVNQFSPGLSLPPGMSGSLVWNTRRVEFAQSNRVWSAEEARVTGMVFSWSVCANWIYATKVEYMRAAFPHLVEALTTRSI
jgi:hypothetical protein